MAKYINKQDADVKMFSASSMMPTTGEHTMMPTTGEHTMMPTTGEHTMQLNRVIGKCRKGHQILIDAIINLHQG